VIFLGVGKFRIACKYFMQGRTVLDVISNPPLNVHATRETHHTPSSFHQARSIPNGKRKTLFDAWNGYHSVPISEEDRHLTTFTTPWGRYRYKTAPQGYIASGDAYTRRYDEIVADIPSKTKCVAL
jgi:hypothetical protein